MTRDEIIKRLAEAFGPHKSYDHASRSYVPDGMDTEGEPFISFVAGDGHLSLRSATYGEIADALAEAAQ